MSSRECVLAFSGGLDTSAIVVWLVEQGYNVHALLVDVGQNEDLESLCEKALRLGAASAIVRDARPAMFQSVVPTAIALGATYEGVYRLGTALARPFIALEQVNLARRLGGATLVHGATGKGNDQIRFEFAYRSLAPDFPVLAPWKEWEFTGRQDLIDYLRHKGFDDDYEVAKDYSLDENLWHLSVEGGVLEAPDADVDVEKILAAVADSFATGGADETPNGAVELTFCNGTPTALDGATMPLSDIVATLNCRYRHVLWAWDLIVENRFTGIKSRGLYINPAAKLLHVAVDALARSSLNKPMYDRYVDLGRQYGEILYRGEYFSDQRRVLEAAATATKGLLNGTVVVKLQPTPYVSRISADRLVFRQEMSTFEHSAFDHADAQGFINLTWLSSIGKPFAEQDHADALETEHDAPSHVCADQPVPARRLVPAAS